MINAHLLLRSLLGETLLTLWRPKPNTILAVGDETVLVRTTKSPDGEGIEIDWVQEALDRLASDGRIELGEGRHRFRSSFLAAVLSTLPMVEFSDSAPRVARVDPDYPMRSDVLDELERRLAMYADLLDGGGPEAVSPDLLRRLRIYGGPRGLDRCCED
jgi:hypothetical protein